jgi:hypothetical protein
MKEFRFQNQEFEEFVRKTNPNFRFQWYHKVQCEFIDHWMKNALQNLMFLAPPKSSKTELLARMLPLYIDKVKPDARILVVTYSDAMAESLERDFMRRHGHINTNVLFIGVGNPLTGIGADYIIIDYQMRPQDVKSVVLRNKIWDWYNNTLLTRRKSTKSKLIMIMSHYEDDLSSRILNCPGMAKEWACIKFPFVATEDTKYRKCGDILMQGFTKEDVEKMKQDIGYIYFTSLLQQEDPVPKRATY